MGISMSSPTSGFRKWSEAHDPKIRDARAVAGEAAVIPVPALDQPIERALPAHKTINQFLAQPAVHRRQACQVQSVGQPILDKFSARPPVQNLRRNFSWFFAAHTL